MRSKNPLTVTLPHPTATPRELRFIAAFTDAVIDRPFLAELIVLRRQRRALERVKAA